MKSFTFLLLPLTMLFTSCSSLRPITTESQVNLDRFMGDWYVIANIPTFLEKDAWNALERYDLRKPGIIDTTFTFNAGGPDGKAKRYTPVGFVREGTGNAVWGMRFVWPIKAEYRILYVDEAYEETIIGRRKRDYLWIMARDAALPEDRVQALIEMAVEAGYDRDAIQRVPHADVPASHPDT
jgi:apolipoprotein D and lipocalin family protein